MVWSLVQEIIVVFSEDNKVISTDEAKDIVENGAPNVKGIGEDDVYDRDDVIGFM